MAVEAVVVELLQKEGAAEEEERPKTEEAEEEEERLKTEVVAEELAVPQRMEEVAEEEELQMTGEVVEEREPPRAAEVVGVLELPKGVVEEEEQTEPPWEAAVGERGELQWKLAVAEEVQGLTAVEKALDATPREAAAVLEKLSEVAEEARMSLEVPEEL